MIKYYIVNLKKDTDKKKHMQKLCKKYNLYPEFIEAVEGYKLSDAEISEVYSIEKAINEMGRKLSRSEIGCALSHKRIYENIIDEKMEIALILEDDIDFDTDIVSLLKIINNIVLDWEVILLGHHTSHSRDIDTESSIWGSTKLTKNYKLVRPCEKGYGTYGYLITNDGAKKILNRLEIITRPIDHYTGDRTYTNLYTINPSPIKICKHFSEKNYSINDRKEYQQFQKSLAQNKTMSMKRRILNILGIYQFLKTIEVSLKRVMRKIKPIKNYK